MPPKRFIVKVQISCTTTMAVSQALIYDKDHTILQQFDAWEELVRRVGSSMKRYMWAHLDRYNRLHLDEDAPAQEW